MKDIRIVFMGTPEFAVEALRRIVDYPFQVVAVVTVPDKPAGRGLKVKESAVKSFAVARGIPVLQPDNLREEAFIEQLQSYQANLFVVVAFRKLPDEIWSMPPLGTFNLHASLLPQYRGAAPINHAVMNGERFTGVTTFFLNSGIDTGKIILNSQLEIAPDETAGELHDRLMNKGAGLVIETIALIAGKQCLPKEQPTATSELKKAPRLFREHCRINWNQDATSVHNHIRGLSPYPGAWAVIQTGKQESEIKILKSAIATLNQSSEPGQAEITEDSRLLVACSDGFIELLMVQPAGKKSMNSREYINGLRSSELRFL